MAEPLGNARVQQPVRPVGRVPDVLQPQRGAVRDGHHHLRRTHRRHGGHSESKTLSGPAKAHARLFDLDWSIW